MNGLTPSRATVRFGIKGPAAEAWLKARGIAVPPEANRIASWMPTGTDSGGRCLRLGFTEFLVEQEGGDDPAAASATPGGEMPGAYLLLRSDCSLVLDGPAWPAALSQLCSFDLARLREQPDLVVMTLLAGIAVTLVREPAQDSARFALRLWCDASYAHYLQESLQAALPEPNPAPGGP